MIQARVSPTPSPTSSARARRRRCVPASRLVSTSSGAEGLTASPSFRADWSRSPQVAWLQALSSSNRYSPCFAGKGHSLYDDGAPRPFSFCPPSIRLSPTPPPIRVFCVRGTQGERWKAEGICFWDREAEVVANECEVGPESAARGCVDLSEFREGGCERVLAVFARNVEFPKKTSGANHARGAFNCKASRDSSVWTEFQVSSALGPRLHVALT